MVESAEIAKPPPRKEKLTRVLLLATVASSLGTFQSGYSLWLVHNPAAILLEFPNSTFERGPVTPKFREKLLGITIIIFPVGGLLGVLLLGCLVDTWGRKGGLVINNCLNIFAASFIDLSRVIYSLKFAIFARFVNGVSSGLMGVAVQRYADGFNLLTVVLTTLLVLACLCVCQNAYNQLHFGVIVLPGIFSCIVPLYIEEISPPNLRGALYLVSMLAFTFGTLVAHLLSLREALGTTRGISILMSLTGGMAIFNIIILHYMPESPRFLFIQRKNENEARKALTQLRGNEDVEEELEDMRQEKLFEKAEKNKNVITLLSCRELRKNLLTTVILMAGNQLTGVNGAYLYAEKIYISLGLEGRHIRFMLIVVNSIVHVVIIVMIIFIDTVGRRFLLLLGFMICSMVCILLAVVLEFQMRDHQIMAYFSTGLIVTFLIGHMIGPGPIPYLMTGELFLQSARGSAYVVGGFMNWFTRFLVGVIFVFIEPKIGPYSLLIFWPICIAVLVYVYKSVPETKGRTFLEIQKGLGTPKRVWKKSEHKRRKSEHKRPK